jgi:hypothetical protein
MLLVRYEEFIKPTTPVRMRLVEKDRSDGVTAHPALDHCDAGDVVLLF